MNTNHDAIGPFTLLAHLDPAGDSNAPCLVLKNRMGHTRRLEGRDGKAKRNGYCSEQRRERDRTPPDNERNDRKT